MFHLHRAERTDTLADALTEIIATGLSDPLRPEVVAVPAAGVERWLAQHISGRLGSSGLGDGIAANIDFCSPTRLADRIVAAASGMPATVESPWRAEALIFPVLRVLDDMIDDPQMLLLARHLGATDDTASETHRRDRRYSTARHIADLFAGYGRSRPTMLAEWGRGTDTDGAGERVPPPMAWQPRFWRRVREVVAEPHPAQTLGETCERLRDDPHCIPESTVPERISMFGPTRISASMLSLLSAVSTHREVHVFVPHPSPALWSSIARLPGGAAPTLRRRARRVPELKNPLVASLSRDVQELQLRIAPLVDHDIHHESDRDCGAEVPARSTLAAIQHAIRDDAPPSQITTADPVGSLADTSVEVHSCHGPERQVEVLRDRILHLFAEDPTLEPRDVLVMCPDIEAFAPLIRGAFGQPGLGHPAFDLRVRLADRGLRGTNAVLDAIATMVELAAGRMGTGDVIDFIGRPPVRERFDFTDDDLDMIREWLSQANVRWAVDTDQRARFGLAGFGQQTFEAGLDRIGLGVVADEDEGQWLGRALPLAGVDSTHIDLVGRFSECVDRIAGFVGDCLDEHTAAEWGDLLIAAIDDFTATGRDEEWQRAQAIRILAEAFDPAEPTTHADPNGPADPITLRLGDVRDLIATEVAARPTRSNFRTGELTVCSMVPMRSVPHRVIILLGVDAETFPRAQRIVGDDILGVDPVVGERQPRDEDRQMFLDAIGAAGEHLLVFYTGTNPVTGARVPPAVVVSELVDTVAITTGRPSTDVVIRHSLHGFDASNFTPDDMPGIAGPFGYDADLLAGAVAGQSTPVSRRLISDVTLPPAEPDDVELSDLIAFLVNPCDAFLRQRLGARLPDEKRPHIDELDVELDALTAWSIGDRFLSELLAGSDIAACQSAELRRGTLPPFAFGTRVLGGISDRAVRLHDAVAQVRSGEAGSRDVVVDLPDGRRVHGTVGDVFGSSIVNATYSTLRAKQRLTTWVRFIALGAAHHASGWSSGRSGSGAPPEPPVTAALALGRSGGRGVGLARSLFAMPDDPSGILFDLVRLRDAGLRRPLPMPLDCALDFTEKYTAPQRMTIALQVARRTFHRQFGPSTDRALRWIHGGDPTADVSFDDLLATRTPDPAGLGGVALSTTPGEPLFCGISQVVWRPLLDHETAT